MCAYRRVKPGDPAVNAAGIFAFASSRGSDGRWRIIPLHDLSAALKLRGRCLPASSRWNRIAGLRLSNDKPIR
jgi:hypothetical protein